MKKLFFALALSVVLTGCQSASLGHRWVRSEVYFGLSKPDGSLITTEEWQKFVDEVVTPKFPSGLSVVDSAGQWRNGSGHIDHEQSKVLILLHPPASVVEDEIDEIRTLYCRRFSQEAVMKVTTRARVAF